MAIYAQLAEDVNGNLQVIGARELSDDQYESLAGNPKQAYFRLLVVDERPQPQPDQVVERGPFVIEPQQVRQTWATRAKTAEESAFDAELAELALLKQMIEALNVAIQAGAGVAPTTAAEAFAQIQALKVQVLRLNRIARWLLRNRT